VKEFDELLAGATIGAIIQVVLKAISWTRPSSAYTFEQKGYLPLPGG